MEKDDRLNMRIPSELADWIKAFAKAHNTTVSAILLDYLEYIRENYDYRRCGNCAAYAAPTAGTRGKCLDNNMLSEPDPEYDICRRWRPRPGILSKLEMPRPE
jgi:hypothetical protein